jgi:hypothetical protein
MTSAKGKRGLALLLITAVGCFALGLATSGLFSGDRSSSAAGGAASASAPPTPPDAPDASPPDAGAPKILFDPSSISLLPDASLHIDLPDPWDAGDPP